MLTTEAVISLSKWIQEWKITYGENPSIDECVTWVEWKFTDCSISQSEKKSIEVILGSNID